jgi:hypothetical protein
MVFLLMEGNKLLAKFTFLWPPLAFQIMISVFELRSPEITILANNLSVFFLLVLLFVLFSHAHSTLFAFVILSRAPDVMHSKLASLNVFVADIAMFRFFCH